MRQGSFVRVFCFERQSRKHNYKKRIKQNIWFGFSESEYAYKLAKPIVPLLMERGYKPDGWLGALLGMQLYADLSSEDAFETKMNDVLRMIKVKMADQNAETGESVCFS